MIMAILEKTGGLEGLPVSFNRLLIEHLVKDQQLFREAGIVSGKNALFSVLQNYTICNLSVFRQRRSVL